jgi:Flp pilus assembly protein TadG
MDSALARPYSRHFLPSISEQVRFGFLSLRQLLQNSTEFFLSCTRVDTIKDSFYLNLFLIFLTLKNQLSRSVISWYMRCFLKMRQSERGATAVEFALILPALLFLILGGLEVSLLLFVQTNLEGATFNASRLGKTGYTQVATSREDTILDAIDDRIGFFLDMNQLNLEAKSYSDFSSIGQPEPFVDVNSNGTRDLTENYTDMNGNGVYDDDMGALSPGQAGEIVVYTVTYPWRIMNPLLHAYMGDHVEISSKFVVKNEPYE